MMIDTEVYREKIKDYSFKQLLQERKQLIEELKRYENNEITEQEMLMKPSPETIYKMNKEYLIELMDLIYEKTEFK